MIEYLAVAGVVGGIITVLDEQNVFPSISNNPGKKWFWDPSRWTATTTPAQVAMLQAQAAARQRAAQAAAEAERKTHTKYVITSYDGQGGEQRFGPNMQSFGGSLQR